MSEWHLIDTAPKDGAGLLLADGETVQLAIWYDDFDPEASGWLAAIYYRNKWHPADETDGYVFPTHWMPLPELPA